MLTILNVDDNRANRYVRSRVLRSAGFEVIEAGTGEAALNLAAEKHPDLVLLDIHLPDISGIEVCRRLRASSATNRIPIVHISATHITTQDEATSLGAGADIYLAEPVGPQELSSAVRTLLRLRTTERGLAATEERLRLATEGAGIATWDIDAASGSAVWGRQFNTMLGFNKLPEAPSFDTWLARVHPEDRPDVTRAYKSAIAGESGFRSEHRVVPDDGEERCIHAVGHLYRDEAGGPARLIGVATDITGRKRIEREREVLLRQAQEARGLAEQAVHMKDEFLAMLSHELRTPMSAMRGWLDLLKLGKLSADQQATALETIERNIRIQTQLVNDLLDVSRIVTGKMELNAEAMAVDLALESAIDSARLESRARDIELVPQLERGAWSIRGNPTRVQQIFGNLLSNAIKFSPKGSRIEIRLQRSANAARISITDQGEGISPALLPYIFDRFRQADSSTRRRHGGLGLGLAIVRSLVELHGGAVSATSEGLGRGSTFTVSLPLVEEAARAAPAGSSLSVDANLAGIRVLVVDDDESNLKMIAQMLRLHGASVAIASESMNAGSIARNWGPDVLVLDIGMPDKDGYELLPELRELLGKDAGALPAVALTGFASIEDSQRAYKAGFQAHLPKPFEMAGLCRLVAELAKAAR